MHYLIGVLYEANIGRAPSFYVSGPNQTTVLAKWVHQLDDKHVAGVSLRNLLMIPLRALREVSRQ